MRQCGSATHTLSSLAAPGSEEYVRLAITLAFMVGALQLIMGMADKGYLCLEGGSVLVKFITAQAALDPEAIRQWEAKHKKWFVMAGAGAGYAMWNFSSPGPDEEGFVTVPAVRLCAKTSSAVQMRATINV